MYQLNVVSTLVLSWSWNGTQFVFSLDIFWPPLDPTRLSSASCGLDVSLPKLILTSALYCFLWGLEADFTELWKLCFSWCQHIIGFVEQYVSHTCTHTNIHTLGQMHCFKVWPTKPVKVIVCDIFTYINSCFSTLCHLLIKHSGDWTHTQLFKGFHTEHCSKF